MILVNLTPHALVLHGSEDPVTIPASGTIARLAVTREVRPSVEVDGRVLPVTRPTLGAIQGLPAPVDGTIYVASALVAEAAKRPDVMSPGELVRDAAGVIIGARGLCSYV